MNELLLEQIKRSNNQIERKFDRFNNNDQENLDTCVDIIKDLRTLVEHIVTYYYGMTKSIEIIVDKEILRTITNFMKQPLNNIRFLSEVHRYLQVSASHYVIDEISSPRLLAKYLPLLIEIKKWFFEKFKILLLKNISKFTDIQSSSMDMYYELINSKITKHGISPFIDINERYYVYKSTPIFINNDIYYETTIGIASDFASKFNRTIIFSRFKIDDRYAIKINFIDDHIKVNKNIIPIKIATAYKISIRPCEFSNFAKLINLDIRVQSNLSEYTELMELMTLNGWGLYDVVLANKENFEQIKKMVTKNTKKEIIWKILADTRDVINKKKYGTNVLKFLLVNMNNVVIKDQLSDNENFHHLMIKNQPFDNYPVAMSLFKHNTSLLSLIEVFNINEKLDELFYRKIRNKTDNEGILYHKADDLFISNEDANKYMESINQKLNWKNVPTISKTGDFYFIEECEKSTKNIIDKLQLLTDGKMYDYSNYIRNQLANTGYEIDSEEKKEFIMKFFEDSKVACIFGPAGTGKSFLARHISHLFANVSKKYISNTHPAVMNMYRKIGGAKDDFLTIKSYLNKKPICDILFIDECSMVSNKDMNKILILNNFKYLVLMGDISQIQAIEYGSWFKISKSLLKKNSKYELSVLHRTTLPQLKILWEKVRNKEDIVDELLSSYGYVNEIDSEKLFNYTENQIILCLNYNGLYGINNLNLILQNKNPNDFIQIGSLKYKINDPILFTENSKYSKILYNNLKGRITGFNSGKDYAEIFINVETNINIMTIDDVKDLKLIKVNNDNTSDISIKVDLQFDSDNDESSSKMIPFQLAYAISIHKAQGLEYENVKIVISENLDEKVSHDIFYTAITRATNKIELYWTSSTQKKILSNILEEENKQDINIFSSKFNYKIRN